MATETEGLRRWRVTWSLGGLAEYQVEVWARSWQGAREECVLTQGDAESGWAFVVDSKPIEEQQ